MPRQSIATSDPVQARPCDILLGARGIVLGDQGYRPDSTLVERTTHGVVFYHYTHQKRWPQIVADGGLLAYQTLPTRHSPLVPEFEGCRHISGFLEPLPAWLTLCPYFGDFGLQHLQNCIGTLLLRVEVPLDFPGLYVRDYALQMESLCFRKQGREVLGMGFDHRTIKKKAAPHCTRISPSLSTQAVTSHPFLQSFIRAVASPFHTSLFLFAQRNRCRRLHR